jgi:Flp pilus assembly protein TadD
VLDLPDQRVVRWRALVWLVVLVSVEASAAAQEPRAYLQAQTLIREGRFDEGLALLQSLPEAARRNPKTLNLFGIALTGKGELLAANRRFLDALKVRPDFYPALKNLAVNEFDLGKLDRAERHLTRASRLVSGDPVVHSLLGRIALGRKDCAEASGHLAQAGSLLAADPALGIDLVQCQLQAGKDQDALVTLLRIETGRAPLALQFALAVALAERGHVDQALPLFEAVRAQDPSSYDATFDLAVCYVERRRFAEAVGLLRGLMDRGHRTAELYNLLAAALDGDQQTQAAIDALRQATAIAPDQEDNYIDLAALCAEHDAYDLGLEVLEVGLSHCPKSTRLLIQRGVLHAMRRDLALAEESFRQAEQLAPRENLGYAGLGIAKLLAGSPEETVRILRERVREGSKDHLLHYLLGKALVQTGASPGSKEYEEARAALERSVELDGQSASSRAELGRFYLRENRLDEAVAMLEQAHTIDPRDRAACAALAMAYQRQGRPEKAAELTSFMAKLEDEDWAREKQRRRRLVKGTPDAKPSP